MQQTMTTLCAALGFALLPSACTSSDAPAILPGATVTPHLKSLATAVACGDDVAFYGDASPDIRYTYTYNSAGFVTQATGVYAAGGPNDSIDYTWDAAENFTHYLETNGPDQSRVEIAAAYDASNDLTDYTWSETATDYADSWDYAFSGFVGANEPSREVITEQGASGFGYQLDYDSFGRLTSAVPDSGDPTTYTYDDDNLTITVDTDNGAFTGVIVYDADGGELSETWGGSDPSAIASQDVYNWSGDELLSATYSSGSTDAPDQLVTVETDTVRYDCSSARAAHGHKTKLVRSRR
jgi:YD repeat-containing protein